MAEPYSYHQPLALFIVSTISLGIAAVVALWIAMDIIVQKGWKSMMLVMIPVYVINATYLWPITLWTYLLYSRPAKEITGVSCHATTKPSPTERDYETRTEGQNGREISQANDCHSQTRDVEKKATESGQRDFHQSYNQHQHQHQHREDLKDHQQHEGHQSHDSDRSHRGHKHGRERPMFATVTIAVCHCGAGCVLGDIVGEWLVYSTGAIINGEALWVNYLVDFAFAISFGIVFQYFSIAPMSGDYGIKSVVRAAKADFLSLVFFEVGLFSWMAVFQIAIFQWQLPMTTVTYWWMMQVGMFCGHWTGVPINWWLIKKGVKEPCA